MPYHTFQQLHQSYLHSHPHRHKPKNVVCRGNCCTKIHQLYIYFPLGRWKDDRKTKRQENRDKRMSVFDKTTTTIYHILFAENNTGSITKFTDPKGAAWRGRGILIQKSLPWPNTSCSWLLAGNSQTSDQLGMFHLHFPRKCVNSLSATLFGDAASQPRLGWYISNLGHQRMIITEIGPNMWKATSVQVCSIQMSYPSLIPTPLSELHQGQSDCSPSAMRQHLFLLLRSNWLGQVCKTPTTSKCCI